jgi:hypothetical protein
VQRAAALATPRSSTPRLSTPHVQRRHLRNSAFNKIHSFYIMCFLFNSNI